MLGQERIPRAAAEPGHQISDRGDKYRSVENSDGDVEIELNIMTYGKVFDVRF